MADLTIGPDGEGRVVEIEAGTITRIRTSERGDPRRRIEPGRVNDHTHLYSGLVPLGMPAPDPPPQSFVEILRRVWWRLDRALDAEALRAAARYYIAEALLLGTSAVIDHHESPGMIEGSLSILADACEELGMRALLTYGATERNGGPEEAARGLLECRRFLAERRAGRVRGMIGLHASFTVSDETLLAAARAAHETGAPVHVHVAEDRHDCEDAARRGHLGPLQRLLAQGALPPGSILAHGVHLTPAEVEMAEERGLWLVHNPRSNEKNRVGYAAELTRSRRVALGTDGWPSDLAAEARAVREEGQGVARLDAGRALFAERFGARDRGIEAGAPADLGIFEGGRCLTLVAGGRVVVQDGRLLTADIEEIRAEARGAARRLWERMRAIPG